MMVAGLVSIAFIACAAFVLIVWHGNQHSEIYLMMLISFCGMLTNQLVGLKRANDTHEDVQLIKKAVNGHDETLS